MSTTQPTAAREGGPVINRLHKAVKRHSGMDNDQLIEAGEHGADAGWPGFTYYGDTVAFFKKHRALIVELVNEQAESMGETPIEMVASFQCLAGREMRRTHTGYQDARAESINRALLQEYYPSVSRCLYGGRLTDNDTDVANALAWFALEEVGRWLESERESAH